MIVCTESYGDKFVKDLSNISDLVLKKHVANCRQVYLMH